MSPEDSEYYRQSARRERKAAKRADDWAISNLHSELADRYDELAILGRPRRYYAPAGKPEGAADFR